MADSIRAIGDAYGDEAAERYMADLSHDLWDLVWDGMSPERRVIIAGFFAWVLFRPDILETRFSVDVVRGRIERQIDDVLRWEPHPSVVTEYRRLYQYVRRVIERDRRLRELVATYEACEKAAPWL